jgi:phosphohistidine phosphatase
MHMLHLLRHAKSSWQDGVEDYQRPLSRRGREAARRLGRDLPAISGGIDLVLCSSAVRTRETLDLALSGFALRPPCLIEDGLYLADSNKLLDRLQRLGESDGNVMVIGHNPGLHELAVTLAAPDTAQSRTLAAGKFPTAARASLSITTPWAALAGTRHSLVDYVVVRSLPDGKD